MGSDTSRASSREYSPAPELAGLGTATDLGLGLLELEFTLSSTLVTFPSVVFFRTGLRRGGVVVVGAGAGLEAKVTERPCAGGEGGEGGLVCSCGCPSFSWWQQQ